jgi:hypothetical protein
MKVGKRASIFGEEGNLLNMMIQGLFLGIGFSLSDVLFTVIQHIFHFEIK